MEGGGKDSKYWYKLQIEFWLLQCRLLILIINTFNSVSRG